MLPANRALGFGMWAGISYDAPMLRTILQTGLLAGLLLLGLPTCFTGSEPDPLPFDLRPAMASVQRDAAHVARFLAAGRPAESLPVLARLSGLRLSDRPGVPADFERLEQEFKNAAREMVAAIEAQDRRRTSRRFSTLLDRCDACHARYRPGGIAGS